MSKNFDRIMQGLGEVSNFVRNKANKKAFRVHVPEKVNVKAIRKKSKLMQE